MSDKVPTLHEIAFSDLERELAVTRTVLDRLPPEHYGWKPHAKSMTMGQLAAHVATLPGWILASLAGDELDVKSAPKTEKELTTREQLLAQFDGNADALRKAVATFDSATMQAPWTMRNGEQVIVTKPRSTVYRIYSFNHMVHHRGQLCLYLRLLDVPVPTVYFNTADDRSMVFE